MLSIAYLAFMAAQLALAVAAVGLWRRRPSLRALTLALPIAALVWDNGVVAFGALVGEGPTLVALTYPRFVGHALLTPIWILTAFALAQWAGLRLAQGRRARIAAWGLYGLMASLGLVASVALLRLEPVSRDGILYYTNVGGLPGPPVPAIVMVLAVIAAGVVLLRRFGWPWLLAGGVVMFVAAAIPARVVGFWPSNTGEVLLGAAMVATEAFIQRVEREGRTP